MQPSFEGIMAPHASRIMSQTSTHSQMLALALDSAAAMAWEKYGSYGPGQYDSYGLGIVQQLWPGDSTTAMAWGQYDSHGLGTCSLRRTASPQLESALFSTAPTYMHATQLCTGLTGVSSMNTINGH